MNVSLGMILLIVATVLVLFGVGQRVLDKLRLTDKQAILFMALILLGTLIGDIPLGDRFRINLGGAVIPIALCVYMLVKCDGRERLRALIAAVLAGAAVLLIGWFLPEEPDRMPVDPTLLYGIAAGVLGYVFGRSRRGAFIAGVLGVTLADIAQAIITRANGIDQTLTLGGAGALSAIVLAGLIAVLLCELVGEILERAAHGAKDDGERAFERGEKRK